MKNSFTVEWDGWRGAVFFVGDGKLIPFLRRLKAEGKDYEVYFRDEHDARTDMDPVKNFFRRKVEEWLEDGPEEIVRVLSYWASLAGTSGWPRIEGDLAALDREQLEMN